MRAALKALPHYTYNDYIEWKGQWEIINGIPYAMSSASEPKHQYISGALGSEFHFALKKCKDYKTYQPIDYKLKNDVIIQPDMLIVCQPIKKKYLDFPPQLVVEILSPSTADKDRLVKFPIYESQQIPYCLMVDINTEEVEIYKYENGSYQLEKKAKDCIYLFSFKNGCTANIDFAEIW